MAGLKEIPAYVRTATDTQMMEMGLVENIQRENLGAMEIALAYNALIEECQLTHDQLSEKVGKNRSTITNYLRLLNLPAETQLALSNDQISMAHARALVNVEDIELHREILHAIIERHLSVHQTEEMVKNAKKKPAAPKAKKRGELPSKHAAAQSRLKERLQSTVEIKRSQRGKGSLTIHFNSDEDFNRILALIEK
jgi:ParB family chromosome partitioning protein